MTRWMIFAAVLLIVCAPGAAARQWVPFAETQEISGVEVRVLSSDAASTRIEVEVSGMFVERAPGLMPGGVDISIPGASRMQCPGRPNLPVLSYLVAIPDRGGVELSVVSADTREVANYTVSPAPPFEIQGVDPEPAALDAELYASDALYPGELATVSGPMIMRDLRLVQVRIHPVRYNPVSRTLVVTERVELELRHTGREGANPKRVSRSYRSEAFEPIYRSAVLNYGELPKTEVRRGSYLVITMDSYVSQLADLVHWKQARGIETILVPLSDIGASPSNQDIKDYIQVAYDTWDNPPEYVLLVGDTWTGGPAMPCWYVQAPGPTEPTDNPYGQLEGSDYIPDVMVGRLPIDIATEAIVASLKVMSYERDCDAPSDDWYEKALVSAANTGGPHVTSPRQTTLRVREMLFRANYAQVDTVFYPPVTSPTPIANSINGGVGFVCYRGWGDATGWHYPLFLVDDIYSLANNAMLPVLMSIVCGTGNYDSWSADPCFGEAWVRAGVPGDLKGGPVVCAPSHYFTRTRYNNALCVGMYEGILFEDIRHFGQAVLRGKMEMYRNFPLDTEPGGMVQRYFEYYNTLGDPELYLRTARPASFVVTHDSVVSLGENALRVRVTDSGGSAVPGAEVVVWKEDESYEVRALDGGKTIDVPLNAATIGSADVTVYAKNFKPYTGTVTVTQESQYVGWYSHTIDDDSSGASSGNGDGIVNPGETIELFVTLKNYGATGVTGVECDFQFPPGAPISYGTIPAGATASGSGPFVVEIDAGLTEGTELVYTLYAYDGSRTVWESELRLVVGAPVLSYYSVTVDDGGNGVLDPGETATLTVALSNNGLMDATSVAGTLVGPASGLTVTDDVGYWGTIGSGSMGSNTGNTFTVSANAGVAIGHEFTMIIELTGDDGLSQFVLFPLIVGTPTTSNPLGPDNYGYFCYDDTDVGYAEAPTYSWVEIDPGYGGSGIDVGLGYEEITDVPLPFTFRYYGQDFDTIAICSNGDVGLGGAPEWEHQPRNTIIPCPLGPDAMIAPFWDNLFPDDPDTVGGAGEVYTKSFGDGRFVIEWSRVRSAYRDTVSGLPYHQTFELILYDPAEYPTVTGDGEILCQYHTIADADTHNYATVGIENLTQSDGLLYTFYSVRADEAAPLANGRAIKFTTDPPDAFPSTDVPEGDPALGVVLLGNRPNPFNPTTVIGYAMPAAGEVELAVYDVAGRRVATLVDGEIGSGHHQAVWNGRNDSGESVASGIYFARLSALGEERSTKMVLLK